MVDGSFLSGGRAVPPNPPGPSVRSRLVAGFVWHADNLCHRLNIRWNWLCDLNDRYIMGED